MEDLEVNALYKALLGKYKRQFEVACQMAYLVAIPHSDSLGERTIDQQLISAHILMPSKLLKSHFNQLQAPDFGDIELEPRRLVCHPKRVSTGGRPLVVRILAEELGYNAHSKEYRTILIDRPLVAAPHAHQERVSFRAILAPLSPRSQLAVQLARKQRAQLISARALAHHDDCAKYLACISTELTNALELEVRRMQSNYIILAPYLEDAARRARSISDQWARKFELSLEGATRTLDWPSDTIRRSIRSAVENHVVHLLHGKLTAAIHKCYALQDAQLDRKCELIAGARLSLCQLGAQLEFADFVLSDELARQVKRLPNSQSPIAMVACLTQLIDLIGERLNQSAHFKRLHASARRAPTPICSDDLIATLVYLIPRLRPANLFSAVRYLELFGWTCVERDQSAYYLATLDSAVTYIMNFSPQETTSSNSREAPRVRALNADELTPRQ